MKILVTSDTFVEKVIVAPKRKSGGPDVSRIGISALSVLLKTEYPFLTKPDLKNVDRLLAGGKSVIIDEETKPRYLEYHGSVGQFHKEYGKRGTQIWKPLDILVSRDLLVAKLKKDLKIGWISSGICPRGKRGASPKIIVLTDKYADKVPGWFLGYEIEVRSEIKGVFAQSKSRNYAKSPKNK